jgi:hypothetical protein
MKRFMTILDIQLFNLNHYIHGSFHWKMRVCGKKLLGQTCLNRFTGRHSAAAGGQLRNGGYNGLMLRLWSFGE